MVIARGSEFNVSGLLERGFCDGLKTVAGFPGSVLNRGGQGIRVADAYGAQNLLGGLPPLNFTSDQQGEFVVIYNGTLQWAADRGAFSQRFSA